MSYPPPGFASPPRRPRVNPWLLGVAAVSVLVIAAVAVIIGLSRSGQDAALVPPRPLGDAAAWSVKTPDAYGEPLYARVSGKVAVVDTMRGVIGLDRANGNHLWWRDYQEDFDATGSWNRVIAGFKVTVVGDAVVISHEPRSGGSIRSWHEVLDLTSGRTRFSVEPKTSDWSVAHVTDTALIKAECDDVKQCEVTAYALSDGRPMWTKAIACSGFPGLPNQANFQQLRGMGGRKEIPPWRAEPQPGIAMFTDTPTGKVTVLNLTTGDIVGTWKRTDGLTYSVVNGHILTIDIDGVAKGIDPATGRELWSHETIRYDTVDDNLFYEPFVYGDLFVHEVGSGGLSRYELVDLSTGTSADIARETGARLQAVTPEVVVGLNDSNVLEASDPASDAPLWMAQLPTCVPGSTEVPLPPAYSMVVDGLLLIGDGYGEFGALEPCARLIDLATGETREIARTAILGYDDHAMVTVSLEEVPNSEEKSPTVSLYTVGRY